MKYFNLKIIFSTIFILLFQHIIFSAGIIDQSFGTNGTLNLNFGTNTNVVDVDVNSNGKIIVAGTLANTTSGKDIFVAQYNVNGTLDTTFGTNGVTITVTNLDETINDLEIQPDGKIVLVGQQQVYEGVPTIFDFLVVRYNAKGQLDNTFGSNGFVIVNQNQPDIFDKVTVQPDEKIVAVGSSDEDPNQIGYLRLIVRFNPNGTIDSSFQNNGFFIQNVSRTLPDLETSFLDVESTPDGKIIAGYNYFRDNPNENSAGFHLLTFSTNSSSDIGFFSLSNRYTNISDKLDFEVLPSGNVAIASEIRNSVFNISTNRLVKGFKQTGANVAAFNNGRFVTSGGIYFGNIQTFSSNAFIGYAYNLPSGKLATQTDGKFLILSNNSLTRVRNLTSQATRIADYDNNGKTDLIVDRPTNNTAYFLRDDSSYNTFSSSNSPRKIIPEYFEVSSGLSNYFRNIVVYRSSNIFYPQVGPTLTLGSQTDRVIGGDYDGDGSSDYSLFTTNGDWISQFSLINPVQSAYHWGTTGDKPVPADYDFDGITDYAVFRPSTGYWWIHRSSNDSYFGFPFGTAEDIPLTGDYDADGFADFVVFRPSTQTWYMLMTTEGFRAIPFGLSTDIPVPGDYDGDGKHDIAVFRNGIWYVLQSRDGFAAYQWGTTGDIPVTVRYDN